MNSNRQVLRPTHNRLPLQDVSSEKTFLGHVKKPWPNTVFPHHQQENCFPPATSRPILTATRSIKKLLKENPPHDEENAMLISPMVTNVHKAKFIGVAKPTVSDEHKTREQLEQDLFELYVRRFSFLRMNDVRFFRPDYRQSIFEHLKSVEYLYAPSMPLSTGSILSSNRS